jgi:hypothetical protein
LLASRKIEWHRGVRVLDVNGRIAFLGKHLVPIKGDVALRPLVQVGVDHRPDAEHLADAFLLAFGQFGLALDDLLGDGGAGAGDRLVQNFVKER